MGQKLLIVESPAKAKTIEKFLGKDFKVKSSYGHVRDLDKGNKGVDIQNNFHPNYIITPDKTKVVKELQEQVKKSDEVWLATDEDREGEAISWHLCEVLGLDISSTKRIVFHEITKNAIQTAVSNPRNLDIDLVNAQQARRVLDRLVGYELSEVLWRKIKGQLSAGRVQSVALRLVVDRERAISKFEAESYFKVKASFPVEANGKSAILNAESNDSINDVTQARTFLEHCIGAQYHVNDINIKPSYKKPAPPFTTSTLQQEASRKLGFAVKRTMIAAQRLYESGQITYMRTDSTNLSEVALQEIAAHIAQHFSPKYVETRRYKTKNQSAQEAHEAIRPTYITNRSIIGDKDQERLYDLIWKRTIASQMANAVLEKTEVSISISTHSNHFLYAVGEVIKFDGFLKVYLESSDDDDDENLNNMLPPLTKGQRLYLNVMEATQRFTKPPARFTEASLVKKMEEIGIGRPSTYAPTISKIMEENRGYVIKDSREGVKRDFLLLVLKNDQITQQTNTEITGTTRNQLYPTDMGMVVTDFLLDNFEEVMNYQFTAEREKDFDTIAEGKMVWTKMIGDFYKPFHADIEDTMATADRATGERILGLDPSSGRTILARMNRLGKPMVQIGKLDELEGDEKPTFANLRAGQSIETITLEEAFQLFTLPKNLGEYQELEVSVNSGRFGPYIKFGEEFISLPRGEDPFEVDLERAMALINEKQKANQPIGYYENIPVTKGKGRFGPYIKWNDLFINVNPRKYNFDELTQDNLDELISQKIEKESNRYIKNWEEEKIAIENGRWGPFIRFGKKMLKLGKTANGEKYSPESLSTISLEEVKVMIEEQVPGAFDKKTRSTTATKKSSAAKSTKAKASTKKTSEKAKSAKTTAKKVK